jgi:hypothetical protein
MGCRVITEDPPRMLAIDEIAEVLYLVEWVAILARSLDTGMADDPVEVSALRVLRATEVTGQFVGSE